MLHKGQRAIQNPLLMVYYFLLITLTRDYVRGGAEGALAPPEFGGSERRTEGETDNPLLIAPSESKS